MKSTFDYKLQREEQDRYSIEREARAEVFAHGKTGQETYNFGLHRVFVDWDAKRLVWHYSNGGMVSLYKGNCKHNDVTDGSFAEGIYYLANIDRSEPIIDTDMPGTFLD